MRARPAGSRLPAATGRCRRRLATREGVGLALRRRRIRLPSRRSRADRRAQRGAPPARTGHRYRSGDHRRAGHDRARCGARARDRQPAPAQIVVVRVADGRRAIIVDRAEALADEMPIAPAPPELVRHRSWSAWRTSAANRSSCSTRTVLAVAGERYEHARATQSTYAASRSARPRNGTASGAQADPAAAAIVASHRIGATAGSASRFAGTASGVRRPKCHHAIGAVTTVHAIETAAASPTAPRRRGCDEEDRGDGGERSAGTRDRRARAGRSRARRRRRTPSDASAGAGRDASHAAETQHARDAGPDDRRARAGHEHVGPGHRSGRQTGGTPITPATPSATSVNAITRATFWPLTATTW